MGGIQFCIPTKVESKPAGTEATRNKPDHAPEPPKDLRISGTSTMKTECRAGLKNWS